MSRWFRHYAGMMRDDKLVRASIKSKQTVERVCWVWCAILESAAEIDDGGRFEVEKEEIARFLRCPASKVAAIEAALEELGRVSEGRVTKWASRQFQSDRSAARTKAYRERHRDGDVTSRERQCDAPETETETEVQLPNGNCAKSDFVDPEKVMFGSGIALLVAAGKSEPQARSLLGKWKRDHGAEAVIAGLGAAQREGAIDPAAFIEGRWRQERKQRANDDEGFSIGGVRMNSPC